MTYRVPQGKLPVYYALQFVEIRFTGPPSTNKSEYWTRDEGAVYNTQAFVNRCQRRKEKVDNIVMVEERPIIK